MLGFNYMKADPTLYVIHRQGGVVKHEGPGLAFFFFAPAATLVGIPLHTVDLPFAFQEVTADYQTVTVQGNLTYRVAEPRKLAALLSFPVDARGHHTTEDPVILGDRMINATQAAARGLIQATPLARTLADTGDLAGRVLAVLREAELLRTHGLEVLSLNIVSLRPTPETLKAMEAEAREALLRNADLAIYDRRNAAVEQERRIKENELETERVIGERRFALREAEMEGEIVIEEKKRLQREARVRADIAVEEKKLELIDKQVENERKMADAKAYALEKTLAPVKEIDWHKLAVLGANGLDARFLIAEAFDRLAQNADKIGQLNVTPDLLTTLLTEKKK